MIKLRHLLYEIENQENNSPDREDVMNAAKSKGYNHFTFRGDINAERITSYTMKERREYGIFTTPIRHVARVYARDKSPRGFYVKAHRILDLTKDTIENMKWVIEWGKKFSPWNDPQSGEDIDAWYALEGGRMFDFEGDWSCYRWKDIQRTADNQGYDAIILPDFDSTVGIFPSFVIFNEKNLKLADTVTYDDSKSPIPLEQRFNSQSSDIRY
jgi:hypothetical protein